MLSRLRYVMSFTYTLVPPRSVYPTTSTRRMSTPSPPLPSLHNLCTLYTQRYLKELEPRLSEVLLQSEVVAYVTTGTNLLKRLNGAQRTRHTEAEKRYRAQLEKLISAFDDRIAAAPSSRIDDFLRGCESVEPPLRGVAERSASRASSMASRLSMSGAQSPFGPAGAMSPIPGAGSAPFFPGIARGPGASPAPNGAAPRGLINDWTSDSFVGRDAEKNMVVFSRELSAFTARKHFYYELREQLLDTVAEMPFGDEKDQVNKLVSAIDEATADKDPADEEDDIDANHNATTPGKATALKGTGPLKGGKGKGKGKGRGPGTPTPNGSASNSEDDKKTIAQLQAQLKKTQRELLALKSKYGSDAPAQSPSRSASRLGGSTASLNGERAPSRAASRHADRITADDVEAFFMEHPTMLTRIALLALKQDGIDVDSKSVKDKAARQRVELDRLTEDNLASSVGVEDERVRKWQVAALMVTRKQERHHAVVLRLAQTVYADISTDHVIKNIMESARDLLNADRCAIFLVDREKKELYSTLAHAGGGSTDTVRFPMTAGIAGHVATTGETLIVDDAYNEPRFNQEIDKATGYRTKTILCMPIRAVNGEIVGVAQVVNKKPEDGKSGDETVYFTEEDAELFEEFAVYCGISICNAQLYESVRHSKSKIQKSLQHTEKLARKLEMVLQFAKLVYQGLETDSLVPQIMELGRALVDADRCALFLFDSEKNELYSHVAEGVDEIRFSAKQGIAGFVATSGQTLIIEDAYEDARFNRDIDKATGYRTKSLLCVPVKNAKDEVIAVCQLVNKKKGSFTSEDEEVFEAFAVFCGIALFNARLYDIAILSQKKTQVALELISYHSVASDYDINQLANSPALKPKITSALPSYHFGLHQFSGDIQSKVIIRTFTETGLARHFNVPIDRLARLVLTMRKNYRRVPYHNFSHAATVTQSMYSYMCQTSMKEYFNELERFAMLIACLCHDVDHRGTNNQFQVESNSPLAQIYNGTSVMENHHWDRSVTILSSPEHNIFSGFSQSDISTFWKLLKQRILDTDLALYFKKRPKFEEIVKGNKFDKTRKDHRELAAAMFMTCCDISSITKPFAQCRYWAEIVSSEFYAQGDVEKAMGKKPQKMFDRDVSKLPEMQVGFIKFVGRPLYALMAEFDTAVKPQVEQLDKNCARWQTIDEGKAKEDDTQYEEDELKAIDKKEKGVYYCEHPDAEDAPSMAEAHMANRDSLSSLGNDGTSSAQVSGLLPHTSNNSDAKLTGQPPAANKASPDASSDRGSSANNSDSDDAASEASDASDASASASQASASQASDSN
eukprot:TRINITY_DN1235_c0_g1_i4.p1 TRINITY_DN1235_c0_g1~~TRINITY_DN1235_c0_g1_i4.p1  ORF type:complete len:1307 (+),score=396.90 TRINITY_DN1235_c0_g1_i4:645-4565(+)